MVHSWSYNGAKLGQYKQRAPIATMIFSTIRITSQEIEILARIILKSGFGVGLGFTTYKDLICTYFQIVLLREVRD